MSKVDARSLYRHTGVALLRAAVCAMDQTPEWWPDPTDAPACRSWLEQVWSRPGFADAITQASPSLAHRVEAICSGGAVEPKPLRRATVSIASYLLRALGRPTPFGLFAGVAPVALGPLVQARWGSAHRPVVRADTQWLVDVIERLEAYPQVLERLDVTFNNLAVRRGDRLEAPCGPDRVSVRYTRAVRAVQDATTTPVRLGALVDTLTETFGADRSVASAMVTDLVRQGFLITCLRAPFTTTDPLAHLLDRLGHLDVGVLPGPAWRLIRDLQNVRTELRCLNDVPPARPEPSLTTAALTRRMRQISTAGRTPVAVDLQLDCRLQLPQHILEEMARAASALLRLTRQPTGWPAWRDYHTAFCDRYGTGTLVPVTDVVDPDAGLGYPPGYPGTVLPDPVDAPSPRDERLLGLAWRTIVEGSREIVLTDDTIDAIASGDPLDAALIPPHVELAARIHATSAKALEGEDYTLTVAPARAGGTLTSRFTPTTTGSGLEQTYRELPTRCDGALPVQMSFGPAYPHAENVCRIPAYLPHVLSLGEHRSRNDETAVIPLADLALTATRECLYLVSVSRRQVIEPQVFHALALDKQPPPLARFLAHLPRAYTATWTVLDWGPAAERLPYLPRVRYGRCVLARARWRINADDLPRHDVDHDVWRKDLDSWFRRWGCPETVELRDDDRSLRLDPTEAVHATILRAHLARHGHAIMTEAIPEGEHGWFGGHAHEIAVPLVRTGTAASNPLTGGLPLLANTSHGQWPSEPAARWLSMRIHTHPDRHYEMITRHIPELVAGLENQAQWWFTRYRTQHQTAHLRLRVRVPNRDRYGSCMAVIGDWAGGLHRDGVAGRLVFDTYRPEVGRYGDGPALEAAEEVFVADSWAVSAQLWHLPAGLIHPTALVAVGMVDIALGLLGPDRGMRWLCTQATPAAVAPDRTVAAQAIRMGQPGALTGLPGWPGEVTYAWHARAEALAAYRRHLSDNADLDTVVESLLHMHHNRAVGIDPDHERSCRRLARQAASSWQARMRAGDHQ